MISVFDQPKHKSAEARQCMQQTWRHFENQNTSVISQLLSVREDIQSIRSFFIWLMQTSQFILRGARRPYVDLWDWCIRSKDNFSPVKLTQLNIIAFFVEFILLRRFFLMFNAIFWRNWCFRVFWLSSWRFFPLCISIGFCPIVFPLVTVLSSLFCHIL